MSAGLGTVSVMPTISTHAVLGAAHTAAVAAAGVIVTVAAGAAVAGAAGTGMAWAVSHSLRVGADRAGRAAAACDAAVQDARRWESTVREVAGRNARVGLLTAACRAEGIPVDTALLTLGYSGQPEAVLGRCGELDRQLARLEQELTRRRRSALLARLHAPAAQGGRTGPLRTGPVRTTGGSGRVRIGSPADTGPAAAPAAGRQPAFAAPFEAEVHAMLTDARVALATVDEHAALADAAAAALRALRRAVDQTGADQPGGQPGSRPPGEAEARLAGLRATAQEVWDAVRRRQTAAVEAAVLIQPLLPEGPGAAMVDAAGEAVRAELLEVMAGTRLLDDPLRGRAVAAIDALLAAAARRHQATVLTEAVHELTDDPEQLEVIEAPDGSVEVRAAIGARHELRLALRPHGPDEEQLLSWTTVRTAEAGPAEAADAVIADDTRVCEAAAAGMDRVDEQLAESGVEHEEETRKPPGSVLPVDALSPEEAAAAARRRAERRRRTEGEQQRRRQLPGS
ncbi:hypothetical protein MXD62_01930 [Frankia sp. Mgl5]|uniref:hypothetical protein n=1 Tax=Frankia sp. Mgl5 TaxID=2933793 RepID=UPI00200E901A|nr:hypothetical protein [Frankia sp. Mgl5]MCK9925930.1 hypothetical protein [Frankia sp. Mgl5]